MPIVKSVGGMSADSPSSSWTGRPVTLPTRSWSAMSIAQRAAPWPRMAASIARSAAREPGGVGPRPRRPRRASSREDGRHRRRRLAVEPVRVALPHPDDAREPVVAQLDDDGRDRVRPPAWSARAIRNGSRSAEVQDLVGQVQAHRPAIDGSASTALADRRPQPVRPEADRVVGRQAGLGGDRGDDPRAPRPSSG